MDKTTQRERLHKIEERLKGVELQLQALKSLKPSGLYREWELAAMVHESPLDKAAAGAEPIVPIEFVYNTFVSEGSSALVEWLERNAPQEVIDLYSVINWAGCYCHEAVQNDGRVSKEINEEAIDAVLKGLRALDRMRVNSKPK